MNLTNILNKRYSTKKFTDQKVSDEDMNKIYDLLQLSPSSVNAQPWHFVIAKTDESKKLISKATQDGYAFNEQKVLTASHVIILCAKIDLDDKYLNLVTDKEQLDGRYESDQEKKMMHNGRSGFVNLHRDLLKDLTNWNERQVYLNAGNLLHGLAHLNIDSVPIEGFDADILAQEFSIEDNGLKPLIIVPIGYRAADDNNADRPKSRLNQENIITIV